MSFNIKKISTSNSLVSIKIGSVVIYEQHSKILLAVTISEKKGKWNLINQSGGNIQLASSRLFLLPLTLDEKDLNKSNVVDALNNLSKESEALEEKLNLEESWNLLAGEVKEISPIELCKLIFNSNTAAQLYALKKALALDTIFFKRKKTTYSPRDKKVVEDLKIQAKVLEKKRIEMQNLMECILNRLKNPQSPLPSNIKKIEEVAALGRQADNDKKVNELLENLESKADLNYKGKIEDKAFKLLVAIGHFSPIENLMPIKLGRPTIFSIEEEKESKNIETNEILNCDERTDLRDVFTITIDGQDTLDFDDAISIEKQSDKTTVGVHIADVSSVINPESKLNSAAMRRGTSIYCPDQIYPMFPISASEEALSLKENEDRPALSFFITFDSSYDIIERSVKRSIIRVNNRLTYKEVDDMLFSEHCENMTLRDTLDALWQIASNREIARISNGAQQFERRQMTPSIDQKGRVSLIRNEDDTPSRKLISEFMILGNETAALFAKENRFPLYFRSQEKSEDGSDEQMYKVPEGPAREYAKRGTLKRSIISMSPGLHAALGLEAYTQATSPIRRMVDLVNQRQIAHFLKNNQAIYDEKMLEDMQEHFSTGLAEAARIQRTRTRFWLLKFIEQEKLKFLNGTIVKIDGPKPIAEVEILFSLFPFHPLNSINLEVPEAREILGKKVKLKIEKLSAINDRLVLKEMEQ